MKKVFQENLNPQQLEAVKHMGGPLLVVAGADAACTCSPALVEAASCRFV